MISSFRLESFNFFRLTRLLADLLLLANDFTSDVVVIVIVIVDASKDVEAFSLLLFNSS